MSGPTNRSDVLRCQLDDVICLVHDTRRRLVPIITRMAQRARTLPEGEDVLRLIEIQGLLDDIENAAKSKR